MNSVCNEIVLHRGGTLEVRATTSIMIKSQVESSLVAAKDATTTKFKGTKI